MFDNDFDDDLDELLLNAKPKLPDPYFDPKYPEIKEGVKFTPIERGIEYSVYTIKDAHAVDNKVKVSEVIYTWGTGYYSRLNKTPFECELDRDDLCSSHSPACQGKKKTFNWRQN